MTRVFLVWTAVLYILHIGAVISTSTSLTDPPQPSVVRVDNGQIEVAPEFPSSDFSSSEFSTEDEESGPNFCPIVHDDEMGDCEKIERIVAILGMPKNSELCVDALAWLEQLSYCCESAASEPSAVCSRNAVRILSSGSKIMQQGDLQ
ncbi:hypothetical protein PSACC_02028 [Paramicrosporidium saccamoebae]|uniref:Uncharacterized protein n=1 Tax=Paramicrosporidium saccamoebae TaxID=1246581 RepID=A0A2H9TK92_9FUNG|nr:hypothetical protein PSACC_02028 [Paramicrosporidium saccamoebae]